MNIAALREFIDLSNTLNFGETANNRFISQSSLSKHIVGMEKELGVQLFIRSKQSVSLTDMGRMFYDKARKIIAIYDSAIYEINSANREMSGTLRVGFLDAAVRSFISKAVYEFQTKYPNIELVLHSGQLGDIERKLKTDELDLILNIQFQTSVLPSGWIFEELFTDTIAGVVSSDNPLAKRDTVSFSDLMAYPLALPDSYQYPDFAKLIKKLENRSGRAVNVACRFNHVDTAAVMVESGAAATILPKHLEYYPHSTRFIRLDDEGSVFKVGAQWKENTAAPGIAEFVSMLMKYVKQ